MIIFLILRLIVMTPFPKIPDEKDFPNDNPSSTDEFSHPTFHMNHEYNASGDDETNSSSDDDHQTNDEQSNGYHPLSQDLNVSVTQRHEQDIGVRNDDDDDDRFYRFVVHRIQTSIEERTANASQNLNETNHSIDSVWTNHPTTENFTFDESKAEYIKTRMLAIQLPESSIPNWAQTCSEQEWQEKLRQKMLSQQTTLFFDRSS